MYKFKKYELTYIYIYTYMRQADICIQTANIKHSQLLEKLK